MVATPTLRQLPHTMSTIRIPFFRIFYSTTYTVLYFITLCIIAITPASLIWASIEQHAFQYAFMISGTCALVAILAIFIYSSRLYTNRSVLAGVGKAYLPIEEGELGGAVRKMIVKQLERSAIIALESRPREIQGEMEDVEDGKREDSPMVDEKQGHLLIGQEISINPRDPPWGIVQHAGWSRSLVEGEDGVSRLEYAPIIEELPNLVEAQAVSLAPHDVSTSRNKDHSATEPLAAEVLRRPAAMGFREYLAQLSYLGLVNPPEIGQEFLSLYERARFSGQPTNDKDFTLLMSTFSELLAGMTEIRPELLLQDRFQIDDEEDIEVADNLLPALNLPSEKLSVDRRSATPESGLRTPVTAHTRISHAATSLLPSHTSSLESFHSVIRRTPNMSAEFTNSADDLPPGGDSSSLLSFPSDAGSVLRHYSDDT